MAPNPSLRLFAHSSRFLFCASLCGVALGFLPATAAAGESEETRDMTRLLNSSIALKYVAKGIQKQYDVKCRAFELESFEDDQFVSTTTCVDAKAGKEEASGVILTIEGTKMNLAPLLLSNIKIDFAG